MVMAAAPVAGAVAKKVAAKIRAKMAAKGKKGVAVPHRRRQKRIVFSQAQWEFVRQLASAMSGGRSVPRGPFRRRGRKRYF